MATGSACISEWDEEGVAEVIAEEFGEEVAKNFRDQGVDGETLQMLATQGSMEQLRECGLRTIKQQMRLKKLMNSIDPPALLPTPDPSPSTAKDRKLSKVELSRLPPEERQTYLIKRNRVQAAVTREWPGNGAPVLKGNKANLARLDSLVTTLTTDCTYNELAGALKSLGSADVRKKYRVADKMSLVLPVARALVAQGIVAISPSVDFGNLVRMDVEKVGTF